ncbi:hypothetical protein BJY18_007119 [Amycolatopsis jiangsuensis]|uniref:Uncharacterized protein n=1 Tax=Amycolatopsis jiangsuensis TaxID=1181879 RepID=A0A840J836_9PSEU|nr:hypothetical protein [Amycolatopsis jiangsuensis]
MSETTVPASDSPPLRAIRVGHGSAGMVERS